jgi:prolyl-tRNA synthetase
MGTSHELGQNFARAFDMTYLDASGTEQLCWTTSWGVSTRMIGGLIMAHGDDNGLRLPPAVAPVQAVVLLVRDEEGAGDRAAALVAELRGAGVRADLDDRVDTGFGRRAVGWELTGAPVRLEVGPRDLAAGAVTLVRRDTGTKESVPVEGAARAVADALEAAQRDLLASARAAREAGTTDVADAAEAVEAARTGFARLPWSALGPEGEARLAAEGVTVRCLRRPDGSVPEADDEPDVVAVVARAY